MNHMKSLKLGAVLTAALAATGCIDKSLTQAEMQSQMDEAFAQLDALPPTTTAPSLQRWSEHADKDTTCAITFTRSTALIYNTTQSESADLPDLHRKPVLEAVLVPCEHIDNAYIVAQRDLSLQHVSKMHLSGTGNNDVSDYMRAERSEMKNKFAEELKTGYKITAVKFIP